ncbi:MULTISPECIES: hypothetical protein [unclassified Francisella]|uniref:hypothetical protein n=1 Tax=unclassified Francisella TaxID=2610885 RepID=UPI002E3116D5|nr:MULTISPECIES: hypothetical protein [unclassified Francisella]MED7818580.1 hypothetical protein [Francisella sp. 19S2-4]MED7829416.1 hypothetical protein [Francisella sp. 19S2-10]
MRENEEGKFLILSPCGICQERLVHWGNDVKAAVTTKNNELVFKTISELMPYHWSEVNN